ncbi:serine/threonine-protein kinase abkC isoform X1 [Tripterygium wilfordii]|uniref:Serine/threonine-protein kinase abkC isoform X1 n=1 Tax=Tripterygium wilfordii TaxID=458696 RepID=A0A7J7C2L0_TRIWF|nr:serine/threonine-protein kinase abkC isoform X1 [Tripterygium wilfordii]
MPAKIERHLCILELHDHKATQSLCPGNIRKKFAIYRFVFFGNRRSIAHSFLWNTRPRDIEANNNGEYSIVGISYTLCRLYQRYRITCGGQSPFLLCKVKGSLQRNGGYRSFYALSVENSLPQQAHMAWKRLSQLCSCGGRAVPPIGRIACAVSLALTRSNLVAPGMLAFIIGEFAQTGQTWAEAEYLPSRDSLYMHAQDGHTFLRTFVFSLMEGILVLLRAMYLAMLFTPCVAMAPFAESIGGQFRSTWLHIVHHTLKKAGPAFIKWGQWAATRPDLFAGDLCCELSKLHTSAPAHDFSFARKSVEKAFGRKLDEIFSKFEEVPVASGSVAQVHRATLKYRYPGQQIKPILVAVKVQHPGVGETIKRDFMIINFVAKASNFIPTLKWLRLDESIEQFAVFMMSQVDLAREAAHLSRFIYNFCSWKDVSFPKPLYPPGSPGCLGGNL